VEVPVLTLAIAVTTWHAGNGPSVVKIVLCWLCFDYFFTEPYYSLEITSRDLPHFFIFVIWHPSLSASARFGAALHQPQDH
jgi:K+-sensing histidine kinase KdpD